MGLSIDRSLAIKTRYTTRLRNIYQSEAKLNHYTNTKINERVLECIYGQKGYQSLPHWCKAYIQGVRDELINQLYRYELEWKHFVRAKEGFVPSDCYLTREQVRALIQEGYTDIHQDINRDSRNLSNYFWKGTDKPYTTGGRGTLNDVESSSESFGG